jgi:hypothetical protein
MVPTSGNGFHNRMTVKKPGDASKGAVVKENEHQRLSVHSPEPGA